MNHKASSLLNTVDTNRGEPRSSAIAGMSLVVHFLFPSRQLTSGLATGAVT